MADWEGPSGHEVNEAAESKPEAQPAEGALPAENPASEPAPEAGAEAVAPPPVPAPDEPPFLIWPPPQGEADVLPENTPMLQVFRRSGLRMRESLGEGVVHATLFLA